MVCDDVVETVFGSQNQNQNQNQNQTAPTKRELWQDDVEEQMFEAAKVLSQIRLTRLFGVPVPV